jgi:kynurenine 3-monooxygenase
VDGTLTFHPYGTEPEQQIWSMSRGVLNQTLVEAAEEAGARVHFGRRVTGVDPATGTLQLEDGTLQGDLVVGADGAFSVVRGSLQKTDRFDYAQAYLAHGYKELTIPPAADGAFRMEPNALHIWPRGGFMMIALPNLDRSFTCTLFLPHHGEPGFDQFRTPDDVAAFFWSTFPDAVPLLTDLTAEFFRNPTGGLITVRCDPWHHGDQVLLLGDAAHAIVPFFGQGMNCAFEDCEVLLGLFDELGGRWGDIFPRFFHARKPNADAIAQLALDNFIEMRDTSADPHFALKRQLEHRLEERYPGQFVSKYSMVSFHRFPYRDALQRGKAQDRILMEVCSRATSLEEIDLATTFARLRGGP